MSDTNQAAGAAVLQERSRLAELLVAREFAAHPELEQRYGSIGREKSRQDAGFHFSYLGEALQAGSASLFTDYVGWARVMLARRNVLASDLAFHLECMSEVVREQLPGEPGQRAADYIAAALRAMPDMPEDLPTFLHEGAPLTPLAHLYLSALMRGERHVASRLILDAVARQTPVRDIYLQVFQPAQYEIGRLWQLNQISVAQEHYCTAATQLVMSQLYPQIFAHERIGRTLVATCVSGDLHEIGARMVTDFFEMDGWDTYYLGANTPHQAVIQSVIERRADVLAISATITSYVHEVADLIAAVRRHPECRDLTILAGGYPFNLDAELWQKVGADGSARDAQAAITLATRLTESHEAKP